MSRIHDAKTPIMHTCRRAKAGPWWLHPPVPVVLVVLVITVLPVIIGIVLARLLNALVR